jgi:hypothetical protein
VTSLFSVSSCSPSMCPEWSISSGKSCELCSIGRYQTYSNSTYCDGSCPVGQSTSFSGSSICQWCAHRKYSEPASNGCKPCPLGKYQPLSGVSVCIDCLQRAQQGPQTLLIARTTAFQVHSAQVTQPAHLARMALS